MFIGIAVRTAIVIGLVSFSTVGAAAAPAYAPAPAHLTTPSSVAGSGGIVP